MVEKRKSESNENADLNNNIQDSTTDQRLKKRKVENFSNTLITKLSGFFNYNKESTEGDDSDDEKIINTQNFITNFSEKIEDTKNLNFDQMKAILASDDLKSSSEEDVFNALVNWKSGKILDGLNERQNFCKLLKEIRYVYLSKIFLTKNVLDHFDDCIDCMDICKNLLQWHLNPNMRTETTINVKVRRFHKQSLLHISTNKCLEYVHINILDESWSEYLKIEPKIKYSCAAIMMDKLILFGGFSSGNVSNHTWSVDLRSKEFLNMKSMSQKRIFFDVAVIDKTLYAIGGMDVNRQGMNDVEMWNSSKDTWEKVASLKSKRYHHAAVVHDEKIFVFGGYYGKTYLKSFEVYDIKSNDWKQYKIGNDIVCYDFFHPKAAILKDDIYLYECFEQSSKPKEHHVKRMNVKDLKNWTKITELPISQECHNLVTFNGKIIFFGIKTNFEYDPVRNEWSNFSPDISIERYNHVMCVSKSHLNYNKY